VVSILKKTNGRGGGGEREESFSHSLLGGKPTSGKTACEVFKKEKMETKARGKQMTRPYAKTSLKKQTRRRRGCHLVGVKGKSGS